MSNPKIRRWARGEPTLRAPTIALDTETTLIIDHNITDLVTLQAYAGGDVVHVVWWEDVPAYMDDLMRGNPRSRLVMHNAAFDYWVLHKQLKGEKSFELLVQAVEEGRLSDTMLRYTMWHVANRGFVGKRSLEWACNDMLKVKASKDASVRLTFTRDMELDLAHMIYASDDAVLTWRLDEAIHPDFTQGEKYHVQGAIALADISRRGLLVDEERRSRLEGAYQAKMDECLLVLADNNYFPGQKGNQKILAQRLEEIEAVHNVRFKRTEKTGKISVTDESISSVGEIDAPFIKALKEHAHYNKIKSTYLSTETIGSDGRVHTRFDPYVVTGRTSSSKPNVFGLN